MLEEGVKEGRIEEVALDASVERILTLKEKAGLFDRRVYDMRTVETWVGCGAHRKAVQKVADAGVTLLRGPEKLEGPVAYAAVVAPGTPGDLTTFVQELSAMVEIERDAKRCVVAAFGEPGEALAAEVNRARERNAEVVVVSFGTPEMLRAVPDVAGAVCAYGLDEASQRAAALALAGKIPFRGRLPIPSPFPE
jgi:beta-N-acetylhexosaminidase